jgi:hypothetical protein
LRRRKAYRKPDTVFQQFSPCSGSVDRRTLIAMISRLATLMLLASLLMIGCATQQQQQFTPDQTAREERDQRLWVRDQDGRIQ